MRAARHPTPFAHLTAPASGASGASGGGGGKSSDAPVDCVVDWTVTTACEGDCWAAEQVEQGTVVTQPANGGAACPPLTRTVSCAHTMPCVCRGIALPITAENSVTTCNDCDYMAPGDTCHLTCVDPSLIMSGTPAIVCANGMWAFGGLLPTCNAAIAQCPPVLASGGACSGEGAGVILRPGSVCAGAREGDVCSISCAAGFALAPGAAAAATCRSGAWDAPLVCVPQLNCVTPNGQPDACAGCTASGGGGASGGGTPSG